MFPSTHVPLVKSGVGGREPPLTHKSIVHLECYSNRRIIILSFIDINGEIVLKIWKNHPEDQYG